MGIFKDEDPFMPKWWIAAGPAEYWQTAFNFGKIWGVTDKKYAQWNRLSNGDYVLFYATKPVSGIIGYGVVRTKFKQDRPLWPKEIEEGRVIWPYRFEFDVEYCLPQDKWVTDKVSSYYISAAARGGFQIVKEEEAQEIIQNLTLQVKPEISVKVEQHPPQEKPVSTHDEIKDVLIELGKLQGFIAESEYDMDGGKLDVVWRRVERGSPTYVFEVQIGGDLYHAIGKLKHANDLWNSNIFLIVTHDDISKAKNLLTGTFHEIQGKIRIIELENIQKLYLLKKAYRDFEAELGIH
ncbi:MAG: hypothetical protein QXD04_06355 [Candidatus Bathyarchaeia archaeon]